MRWHITIGQKLKMFFGNPVVGGIGTFVTCVSLFVAWFFYNASKIDPKVNMYVHPEQTVMVRQLSPELIVLFDYEFITSDITNVKVAIWNAGQASIKEENILGPVVLYTYDGCPILDAKVIDASREEIIGVVLDKNELNQGKVGIKWKILEKSDGVVIELTCCRGTEIKIEANGTIENQGPINCISKDIIQMSNESYSTNKANATFIGTFFLIFSAIFALTLLSVIVYEKKVGKKIDLMIMCQGLFIILVFGCLGGFFLVYMQISVTPFGF